MMVKVSLEKNEKAYKYFDRFLDTRKIKRKYSNAQSDDTKHFKNK